MLILEMNDLPSEIHEEGFALQIDRMAINLDRQLILRKRKIEPIRSLNTWSENLVLAFAMNLATLKPAG